MSKEEMADKEIKEYIKKNKKELDLLYNDIIQYGECYYDTKIGRVHPLNIIFNKNYNDNN